VDNIFKRTKEIAHIRLSDEKRSHQMKDALDKAGEKLTPYGGS